MWSTINNDTRTELLVLITPHVIQGVERARAITRWRMDGTPYTVALANGKVTVRIEDELGKIDLNQASRDLLESV